MILWLYHDHPKEAPVLARAIAHLYGIEVEDRGRLSMPAGAQQNAAFLLRHLERRSGAHPTLWLVDRSLFFPRTGELFGCAAGRLALLSGADLDLDTLVKEALHEVGHILGLDHCKGPCLMSLSRSHEEARAKPPVLCPDCSAQLERLLSP
ncbi:MAG: hypothetical protein JW986_03225 [Methanotrichaceae archaeon]|nr:hypothetical protein [Methanotrichaceae archaeon]